MAEREDRERFWRAVLGIGTCMLVTKSGEGLHGRPMQALPDPEDRSIWFLSDKATHKEEEIRADPSACLTFADPEEDVYVSVTGSMELVDDRAKLAELWSIEAGSCFEGPDDPDIVVLRFTPSVAGLWDGAEFDSDEDEEDDGEEQEASFEGIRVIFAARHGPAA